MQYFVLVSFDLQELYAQVNQYRSEGYSLGGFSTASCGRTGSIQYSQVVYK